MHAMTVCAGRDILVTSRQGRAVDARLVRIVNRAVTLGAGLRNRHSGFGQELPGALIGETLLGVWVMTIGTDRGVVVPGGDRSLVDTIQCALILVGVTLLAGRIKIQRKFSRAIRGHFRVWKPGDVRVAIYTGDVFGSMNRGVKVPGVDRKRNRLSPDLSGHTLLLVTG